MRDLIAAVVAGLIGAVILHIVIILTMPQFAAGDAWSKVTALGAEGQFHRLAGGGGLADADPFLRSAICVYDASEGPVRITAEGALPFWSLAAFDRHSNELYSMNDRSAVERHVDVTLATPVEMIDLKRDKPEDLARSVLVAIAKPRGYIVLRTIAEDPTYDTIAHDFLASAACAPYETP